MSWQIKYYSLKKSQKKKKKIIFSQRNIVHGPLKKWGVVHGVANNDSIQEHLHHDCRIQPVFVEIVEDFGVVDEVENDAQNIHCYEIGEEVDSEGTEGDGHERVGDHWPELLQTDCL